MVSDSCASVGREASAGLLEELARRLKAEGYGFVTVTPETHRRILARRTGASAASSRDIWGWNLPFSEGMLPAELHTALREAGLIVRQGALWRSRVRFSTVESRLFVHSSYPTTDAEAVFFGPDTYRFVSLVRDEIQLRGARARRLLDVGCGGGAGGLMAATFLGALGTPVAQVELVDINAHALSMAAVNARANGFGRFELRQADLYAGTSSGLDLIIANPPYLVDPGERIYRHGGGSLGFDLSQRIVAEGIPLLAAGGRLVLYTGVPILDGKDHFRAAIAPLIRQDGLTARYWELDPDVFGEELDQPAYSEADRIAAIALVIERRCRGDVR